jgi:DNA-binding response OmpR family regulator
MDGTVALKNYVERGPYDIVLTDIAHSGMDGIEILEESIRLKRFKDVLLLMKPWRVSQLLKLIDDTARRGCGGS